MQKNNWKTHTTEVRYENPWIAVSHREVTTPGGSPGIYGVVHFKNLAIGIVPVDEAGNTWLVGQFRYPHQKYSWEIPEGGGPHAEDPLVAAKRELREETGIEASDWSELLRTDLSNSVSDESGILYLATGLTFGEPEPEDTEALTVRKLPLREAVEMVLRGEITDSLSQIGLLLAERHLNR